MVSSMDSAAGAGHLMNFASDNWAGAHPAISAGLSAAAQGFSAPYGSGAVDQKVAEQFKALFGSQAETFLIGTGTAANALGLSAVARPGGIVFCQREAHVIADECGAPEFFSGGARLHPVDGPLGKIDPARLETAISAFAPGSVHSGQAMAVTITQLSEAGVAYSIDEIRAISAVCRAFGLPLHMDGARFANALVTLGITPAEMTEGIDILSFGATKNGCWCAEALVFLDPALAPQVPYLRKRGAQLFSKSRFMAAQFEAYFRDDLWLMLAGHANAMAQELAAHARHSPRLRLAWEPHGNEVFIAMPKAEYDRLETAGARFYQWSVPHFFRDALGEGEVLTRFVTSFATERSEVEAFGRLVA